MSEHVFKVSITSMHTWFQMVMPASLMFGLKSKQVCIKHFCRLLMSSVFVMAALWNRAGHYIFALCFLLSSSFFFFSLA